MDLSDTSLPFRVFLGLAGVLTALLAALALAGRLDSTVPDVGWVDYDSTTPVSGEVLLQVVAADSRPGLRRVTVQLGELEPVVATTVGAQQGDGPAVTHEVRLDTRVVPDGPHNLTVIATDRSVLRNRCAIHDLIRVDNTPPTIELAGASRTTRQGATLPLIVGADEELRELRASFAEREVVLHPLGEEDRYRALAGIGVQEGSFAIELRATDLAGNAATVGSEVEVEEVDWPRGGYVNLSSQQQKAQKDRTRGKEANRKRGEAYDRTGPDPLWTGTFDWPAEGIVTSPFGKFREYSSGVKRHHLGIDIANATGTPIRAPAAGAVTLAEELHIYGKAVILSHGQQISSSYNHLSVIEVEVGDRVERGQIIGRMGSTGQSTGSHLHWGMVANGVAVDPGEWTETDFGDVLQLSGPSPSAP